MVGVLPHLLGKCLPLRIVIGQLVGPVGQIRNRPHVDQRRQSFQQLGRRAVYGIIGIDGGRGIAGVQPQLLTNGVQQLGNADGF